MELTQQVKDIAQKIGQYYLKKHNGSYDACADAIDALRISKIEVDETSVSITTARPGMLIGVKGNNIDALSQFLDGGIGLKIKVIEDRDTLRDYLVPVDPKEFEDDFDYNDIDDEFEKLNYLHELNEFNEFNPDWGRP